MVTLIDSDGPRLAAAENLARVRFGHAGLRPHQGEVLRGLFGGRDVLAVLPTGSGKSLCYVLPALTGRGLALVVSPLIALMRDQVRRLEADGVPCVAFDCLQDGEARDSAWRRLADGDIKVAFVSPERLARPDFRARLRETPLPLDLVAVDEAHCISQWGGAFRPEYRQIGAYLAEFRGVPRLAVTATATAKVRAEIAAALALTTPLEVIAAHARENLRLTIVHAAKVAEHRAATLQAVQVTAGQGIVYVATRREAVEVARMLADAGETVAVYHGGMDQAARMAAHRAFVDGTARVVVATHAFGLGIDKADIRFVHHAGLPASPEQYVQEVGRAGRDGGPARCTLVWSGRDYHVQNFLLERTFPAPEVLATALRLLEEIWSGGPVMSRERALKALEGAVGGRDAGAVLTLLCREGVVAELRQPGRRDPDGETVLMRGDHSAAEFFARYPARRDAARERLAAMRELAAAGGPAERFLDHYFDVPSPPPPRRATGTCDDGRAGASA